MFGVVIKIFLFKAGGMGTIQQHKKGFESSYPAQFMRGMMAKDFDNGSKWNTYLTNFSSGGQASAAAVSIAGEDETALPYILFWK